MIHDSRGDDFVLLPGCMDEYSLLEYDKLVLSESATISRGLGNGGPTRVCTADYEYLRSAIVGVSTGASLN